MGIYSRFKSAIAAGVAAATSAQPYLDASSRELAGVGNGPKPRPFDYAAAIRQYNSWAYAAAMLNASAFASTPKRLYARNRPGLKAMYVTRPVPRGVMKYLRGDGATSPAAAALTKVAEFGGDIVEVVEPHPALTVLKTVNGIQNGYELELHRLLDLQITGNTYLYPVAGPLGVPDQCWRMPPQMVKIVGSAMTYVGGYVYGSGAQERRFGPGEVIHFKLPNPADMLYGRGWYEAGWTALGLNASKRELDTSTYDNYARPDWLLSVPGGLPAAMDKLEKSLTEKFRKPGRRERTAFLAVNQETKATALNWQTTEIGTPTRVIEEVSAVSGVPVAMLLSNDPTRASSDSARLGWYRNTIQPYCRLDEEKLNERWLPLFEGAEDLFIAHDPANFEDRTAQSRRLVELVKGGVYTPNEARGELNMEPHADGDDLFAPVGATGGGALTDRGDGSVAAIPNDDRGADDADASQQ